MGRWVWVAGALLAAACGSSGGGKVPEGDSPGDAGGAGTDAGIRDGGAGASPTDGGVGTADGGGGGVPADGGTGGPGGSTDAGWPLAPDGGQLACVPTLPTPSEPSCATLMPATVGAPRQRLGPELDGGFYACPGVSASDSNGFFVESQILAASDGTTVTGLDATLFSLAGEARGSESWRTTNPALGGLSIQVLLEPAGIDLFLGTSGGDSALLSFSDSGASRQEDDPRFSSIDVFPGGGTIIAQGGSLSSPDGGGATTPIHVTRRDVAGNALWSTALPVSGLYPQAYVNNRGSTLTVIATDYDHFEGIWLDDGGTIVGTFVFPPGIVGAELRTAFDGVMKLADGSIALSVGGVSAIPRARFLMRDRGQPEPPPCWLYDRPQSSLFPIRGAGGYATVSSGQGSTGSQGGLEVLTLSGGSCGFVQASCGDPPSPFCDLSFANIGLDGTVWVSEYSGGPRQRCLYEYWPGLLK